MLIASTREHVAGCVRFEVHRWVARARFILRSDAQSKLGESTERARSYSSGIGRVLIFDIDGFTWKLLEAGGLMELGSGSGSADSVPWYPL